jgi:hypothetical protein
MVSATLLLSATICFGIVISQETFQPSLSKINYLTSSFNSCGNLQIDSTGLIWTFCRPAANPSWISILKLDSKGTVITSFTWNNSSANPVMLAIDNLLQEVYLCGFATGPVDGQAFSGNYDTLISKWSMSGQRIWSKVFLSAVNYDAVTQCVFDPVTAHCTRANTVVVLKYLICVAAQV